MSSGLRSRSTPAQLEAARVYRANVAAQMRAESAAAQRR
jgi:hypothetical protein